jgi:hypothetical protein
MIPEMYQGRRKDNLSGSGSTLITPADNVALVNPASGQAEVAIALYVEGAGSVVFVGADGKTDTWNVPANFYICVPIVQVKAASSATGIHAIW